MANKNAERKSFLSSCFHTRTTILRIIIEMPMIPKSEGTVQRKNQPKMRFDKNTIGANKPKIESGNHSIAR